jgi:hypothetical protein
MAVFDFRALSCRTPDRCAAAPSPIYIVCYHTIMRGQWCMAGPAPKGARVGCIVSSAKFTSRAAGARRCRLYLQRPLSDRASMSALGAWQTFVSGSIRLNAVSVRDRSDAQLRALGETLLDPYATGWMDPTERFMGNKLAAEFESSQAHQRGFRGRSFPSMGRRRGRFFRSLVATAVRGEPSQDGRRFATFCRSA